MKSATEWPAASVEMRAIASLVPYARNSRTHSVEQIDQIAASMREWGWTNPVLVDETGMIIAGHGRILAAQKLDLTEAPVMTARGWSEGQKRAYVIADNKLALNAGWDMEKLAVEIGDLQGAGFDVNLIGFTEEELAKMAGGTEGLTDPDAVPEENARAVSVLGDVWLLGGHRLVCGDSTDAATVAACLGQEKPHLMVTDPPYGVNYDPVWRNDAAASATRRTGKVLNDDRADWQEAWALFPGDIAYVWHGALHATTVAGSLLAAGFDIRSQIIWAKERLVLSRGDYHWQHEPCWYAVRRNGKGHWTGDRKQTTLWSIASRDQDAETVHGTQKPVECMRRPILNNSKPGDAVYDPFLGSGTTLIAAETEGRRCFGIELNPAYVDVIVRRWQDFTGLKATLQGTDKTWEDVANDRYDFRKDGLGSWEEWCAAKRKETTDARAQATP